MAGPSTDPRRGGARDRRQRRHAAPLGPRRQARARRATSATAAACRPREVERLRGAPAAPPTGDALSARNRFPGRRALGRGRRRDGAGRDRGRAVPGHRRDHARRGRGARAGAGVEATAAVKATSVMVERGRRGERALCRASRRSSPSSRRRRRLRRASDGGTTTSGGEQLDRLRRRLARPTRSPPTPTFAGADVSFRSPAPTSSPRRSARASSPTSSPPPTPSCPTSSTRRAGREAGRVRRQPARARGARPAAPIDSLDDLDQAGRRRSRSAPRPCRSAPTRARCSTGCRPAQSEGDPRQRALRTSPTSAGIVGKLTQGAVDAGFVYVTDVDATDGELEAIELPASAAAARSPTAPPWSRARKQPERAPGSSSTACSTATARQALAGRRLRPAAGGDVSAAAGSPVAAGRRAGASRWRS